ncbi:hypothetical protein ABL78_5988 [Leptomonas seymouri]|uniref:Uncharacterized protein n=1 Tax=Leptomonas seymouri TaxID=5684 RepID=A0A0N1HW26_LEPSE|nr:hypothetical protein ABL78_5988 [Leptomonas seymouri]|eukprot:KPI84945.1 hypothetical protein ABL78_5988 [Leptomonas seymouri]
MKAEFQFDAEERFRGPPKNIPERALDYDRRKDDSLLENRRPASRSLHPRPLSRESPFVVIEPPVPDFVVDTVDPSPCPAHHVQRI